MTHNVHFSPEEHRLYHTTKNVVVEVIDAAVMHAEADAGRSYFNTLQRINGLRYICNHGANPSRRSSSCAQSTLDRKKPSIYWQSDVLLGANSNGNCGLCGSELLNEQESEEALLQVGDAPSSITEACPTCMMSTWGACSPSPFSAVSSACDSYASSPSPCIHLSSKIQSLVRAIQQVPA